MHEYYKAHLLSAIYEAHLSASQNIKRQTKRLMYLMMHTKIEYSVI